MAAASLIEVLEPPSPAVPVSETAFREAGPELELAVVLHLGTTALEVVRLRASDVVALADFNADPTLAAATELIAALRGRGVRLTQKRVAAPSAPAKPAAFKPGNSKNPRVQRANILSRVRERLRAGPVSAQTLVDDGICRHVEHAAACIAYLRRRDGADIRLADGCYVLVAEGKTKGKS